MDFFMTDSNRFLWLLQLAQVPRLTTVLKHEATIIPLLDLPSSQSHQLTIKTAGPLSLPSNLTIMTRPHLVHGEGSVDTGTVHRLALLVQAPHGGSHPLGADRHHVNVVRELRS